MLLVLVTVLLITASSSHSLNYCVSESKTCSQSFNCTQHCHPLMWYVNNTESIENNTEIIFLPGNHNLNSSGQSHAVLIFSDKQGLNLTGQDNNASNASTVVCNGNQAGVLFKYSKRIHIRGITFLNCQLLLPKKMPALLNKTSALSFIYSTNITISHVSVTQCLNKSLENILLLINSPRIRKSSTTNYFVIKHSNFLFNNTKHKGKGLYLNIPTPNTAVTLQNIAIINGSSKYGGNIEIVTIDFNKNKFTITESRIINGTAEHGGGLYFIFERYKDIKLRSRTNTTNVTIKNTEFKGNKAFKTGGAVRLQTDDFRVHGIIQFHNCLFEKNNANAGGALLIQALRIPTHKYHTNPQMRVIFDNCTINENNLLQNYYNHDSGNEIVSLYTVDKVLITNTNFTNNNGTALLIKQSTVLFNESILFYQNLAVYGGALRLCDDSMFFVYNKTNIQFVNNKAAISGGAIYTEDSCSQLIPLCFYQVDSRYTNLNRTILNFVNNTAHYSGDAIYGGSIDTCYLTELFHTRQQKKKLAHKIFQIQPKSASMVTSDPYRVCLCNKTTKKPNCHVTETEMGPHYPGEIFTVYVAAIGQRNGTVPAILYINSWFNVSHKYYKLQRANDCQSIKLTVLSRPNVTVPINISIAQSAHTKHYSKSNLTINVPIVSCPWVFNLSESEQGYFCNCSKILSKNGVSCDINRMSINKIGRNWITCTVPSTSNESNMKVPNCDEVATGQFCQHCDSKKQYFTPYNLSDQCIEGREGRLCGHCKANYSFSLGPPMCIENEKCSIWKTITLLIASFLAGIMLFCFLAFLNITVTAGTISGMLLFTTCVHTNLHIFFYNSPRYQHINDNLIKIISWFNLDLGITVCFYKGMSAYDKQWLEFLFLFYLLLIGIFIVLLSRRSTWFTRLAGRNIVPVLSTVLLFSYTKIIRTCTKVFNCSSNGYLSTKNETRLIWSEDETIDCFTGAHIPLALCSFFFLVAALFYNFCLLFSQCLQRRSHWWVLKWVNKLRPFFDANTGPCRNQYRFWPGLVLLLRLATTVNANNTIIDASDHRITLIAAICFLTLLFSLVLPRGVYKKWPLTALEVWILFLLTVAAITTAIGTAGGHFTSLVNTIAALATFLIIFLYHIYKVVSKTKRWKKMTSKSSKRWKRMIAKVQKKRRNTNITEINEVTPLLHPAGMTPVVQCAHSREPLLDDDPDE